MAEETFSTKAAIAALPDWVTETFDAIYDALSRKDQARGWLDERQRFADQFVAALRKRPRITDWHRYHLLSQLVEVVGRRCSLSRSREAMKKITGIRRSQRNVDRILDPVRYEECETLFDVVTEDVGVLDDEIQSALGTAGGLQEALEDMKPFDGGNIMHPSRISELRAFLQKEQDLLNAAVTDSPAKFVPLLSRDDLIKHFLALFGEIPEGEQPANSAGEAEAEAPAAAEPEPAAAS